MVCPACTLPGTSRCPNGYCYRHCTHSEAEHRALASTARDQNHAQQVAADNREREAVRNRSSDAANAAAQIRASLDQRHDQKVATLLSEKRPREEYVLPAAVTEQELEAHRKQHLDSARAQLAIKRQIEEATKQAEETRNNPSLLDNESKPLACGCHSLCLGFCDADSANKIRDPDDIVFPTYDNVKRATKPLVSAAVAGVLGGGMGVVSHVVNDALAGGVIDLAGTRGAHREHTKAGAKLGLSVVTGAMKDGGVGGALGLAKSVVKELVSEVVSSSIATATMWEQTSISALADKHNITLEAASKLLYETGINAPGMM